MEECAFVSFFQKGFRQLDMSVLERFTQSWFRPWHIAIHQCILQRVQMNKLFMALQDLENLVVTLLLYSLSLSLQYGIVLDAGSSRTTVYLYEWPAEKENNTGVVSETTNCQVQGTNQLT